jgi:hypothetical protein
MTCNLSVFSSKVVSQLSAMSLFKQNPFEIKTQREIKAPRLSKSLEILP